MHSPGCAPSTAGALIARLREQMFRIGDNLTKIGVVYLQAVEPGKALPAIRSRHQIGSRDAGTRRQVYERLAVGARRGGLDRLHADRIQLDTSFLKFVRRKVAPDAIRAGDFGA